MAALQEIAIEEIWLLKMGDNTVVLIEREGVWYEVAREGSRANFSTSLSAQEIACCKEATWLSIREEATG